MYAELNVRIGTEERKAFLQDGFYARIETNNFHKHNYTEFHLVTDGNVKFRLGDKDVFVKKGSLLVVPGWVLHCCIEKEETAMHTTFQLDVEVDKYMVFEINENIIKEFLKEYKNCESDGNYNKIAAYISLFGSYLPCTTNIEAKQIEDYSFLLREFFSTRYANPDISLKELADELHISERQAERIIMKHTGNTFKRELMLTRVTVARHLLKLGDMSLNEIASTVGYHSYAGFWKAMKNQNLL